MLVINLYDDQHHKFVDFVTSLFHEAGHFYKVDDKPFMTRNSFTFFGLHKKKFLRLVEIWALKKYDMFIRFNYGTDNSVDYIEIDFEGLDDSEIEYVVMNMYPEIKNETT